jgi:predicted metal-dependent peptidase
MEDVYEDLTKSPPEEQPEKQPGWMMEPTDEEGKELGEEEFEKELAKAKDQMTQTKMAMDKAGTLPAGLKEKLSDILVGAVNWESVLARFVDSAVMADYSYAKLNRRALNRGLISPSCHSTSIGTILVVIDTSGSTIGRECLNRF